MANAPRPAFSLVTAEPPTTTRIPIVAWVLAVASLGVGAGTWLFGVLGLDEDRCSLAASCQPLLLHAGPLAVAPLAAAAAFAVLRTRGGSLGAVRGASGLALLGGSMVLGSQLLGPDYAGLPGPALLWLGLGAPAAMLGAMDPAARAGPPLLRSPTVWLRSGALLGVALAVAIYAGFWVSAALHEAPSPFRADPAAGVRYAWAASGVGLLLAGALSLGLNPRARPGGGGRPAAEHAPRRLGLTPMLRNLLVAETALAVAAAACGTSLLAHRWTLSEAGAAAAAIGAGAAAGSVAFAAAAPALDAALGRGRFLAVAYSAAAVGPLLVAGYLPQRDAALLGAAAALLAFAFCAAPQRFALAFDLCPSRSRLRSSLDFHGLRLATGAAGVALVALGEPLSPSLGLLLASAYGVFGVAVFAPTLGGLGRR